MLPDAISGPQLQIGKYFSGRGVKLNLCNTSSKADPDDQKAETKANIEDAITRRQSVEGIPANKPQLNRIKVVPFGEQAAVIADIASDTADSTNKYIGAITFNSASFSTPASNEMRRLSEELMTTFSILSDAYAFANAVLAAAALYSGDTVHAAELGKNALTYQLEHASDILKCLAYEYRDDITNFGLNELKRLPGGAEFKGLAPSAYGTALQCMGSPPTGGGCDLLEKYKLLKDKFNSIESSVHYFRSLPSRFKEVGQVYGDITKGPPLTINEDGLKFHQIQIPIEIATPYIGQIASAGPFLLSLLLTCKGNGSSCMDALQGDQSLFLSRFKGAGGTIRTQMVDVTKTIPGVGALMPALPIIGDVVSSLSSYAFRSFGAEAVEDIMASVDPPPVLTITHPADGGVVGYTTDRSVIYVEGHVSDYLPHLVRVSVQVDEGEPSSMGLNLATLITDPDGLTGTAFFRLKVHLMHGGMHLVKVTAFNAGGHEVSQIIRVFVDGTHIPRQDSLTRALASYSWRVVQNDGVVRALGTGRLTYLSASPGEVPSELLSVSGSLVSLSLRASHPDGTTNFDIYFTDSHTGKEITAIQNPLPGEALYWFYARLRPHYLGRTYLNIVGNADSLKFRKYRFEYRGEEGAEQPGAGGFSDPGHTIVESPTFVPGAIARFMHAWETSAQRLTGRYTIRTRMTDGHLPTYTPQDPFPLTKGRYFSATVYEAHLAGFTGLEEVDRATFTLGTPIKPTDFATIVIDPYAKMEVRFDQGNLNPEKGTRFVNVFSIPDGPMISLDGGVQTIGPVWEVYPKMGEDDFTTGGRARLTVHYTQEDVDMNLPLFGTGPGDLARRREILEDNLGIYEEFTDTSSLTGEDGNTATGTYEEGDRRLLLTRRPEGIWTIFTETGDLGSRFLVLPSNSAPFLDPPPFASPFIFSPEAAVGGRPQANIWFNVRTACSPFIYVRAEVEEYNSGRIVAVIADGITNRIPIVLNYIGDSEHPVEKELIDPATGYPEYSGLQKKYYFKTAVANKVTWDGVGEREDGSVGQVKEGVYRVRLKAMDLAGSIGLGETLVIKGKVPPAIEALGSHPTTAGPVTVDASVDGQSVVVIGNAVNPGGFYGYRVGIRPVTVTYWSDSDWIELPSIPVHYFGDDPTRAVIQITHDRLGDLEVGSLANGAYHIEVVLLDVDGNIIDEAGADFTVSNPPGLYNFKGTPNPFSNTMELSVAHSGATAVNFNVTSQSVSSPILPLSLPAVRSPPTGVVWRATFDPASYGLPANTVYQVVPNIQGATPPTTSYFLDAAYIKTNFFITAQIMAPPSGDLGGIVDFKGIAKADYPDSLVRYRLTYNTGSLDEETLIKESARPVVNDVLGTLDVGSLSTEILNVSLTVTGASGQERGFFGTWNVPYSATLWAEPPMLVLGDAVKGNMKFTYRLSRDSHDVHLVIRDLNQSGITIKELAQYPDIPAGNYAVSWDGRDESGVYAPTSGDYICELTSVSGSVSADVIARLRITDSAGFSGNGMLSTDAASGIPKPYFDVALSGKGTYDVPTVVDLKIKKNATEQWTDYTEMDFINVENCEGGGEDHGWSCTIEGDYSTTIWVDISHNCDRPNRGCWTDKNTTCEGGSYSIWTNLLYHPVFDNETFGSGCESVSYAYYSIWQTPYVEVAVSNWGDGTGGCSGDTSYLLANVRAKTMWHYNVRYTPLSGETDFHNAVVYSGRANVYPFEMLFKPVHMQHYDVGVNPHAPYWCPPAYPNCTNSSHSDEPQEGTVFSVNQPASISATYITDPQLEMEPPASSPDQYIQQFSGMTLSAVPNEYSDFKVRNHEGVHYWGSVNQYLGGTVYTRRSPAYPPYPEQWELGPLAFGGNVVKFNSRSAFNIFERAKGDYPGAPRPFPDDPDPRLVNEGPSKTPHTSEWTVLGAKYPMSAKINPDISVATIHTAFGNTIYNDPSAFGFTSGNLTDLGLKYDSGFGTGEAYVEQKADFLVVQLREPSPEPYAARVYLKISGTAKFQPGGSYAIEYKRGEGDSSETIKPIISCTWSVDSGILGYWDVTDIVPGRYTLILTVIDELGHSYVASKAVDAGHRITAAEGGVATDAYEQAVLQFPPGALTSGNEKIVRIRQKRPDEVPFFANNPIEAGLIYELSAAAPTAPEYGLSPNDFVQDANHNVVNPAHLMVRYDERQLPLGVGEGVMNLYRLSNENGMEHVELTPALIDTVANTIMVQVTQFSTYEVLPDPTPPRFNIQASPDPAGQGEVHIFVEATRALQGSPAISYKAPPAYIAHPFSGVKVVTLPYLEGVVVDAGAGAITTIANPERVTLADLPSSLPPSGKWPGVTITIGGTPYKVNRALVDETRSPSRFQVVLTTVSGDPIDDVRTVGIQALQVWSANISHYGVISGAVRGIGTEVTEVSGTVVLRSFAPGESLNIPPAGWFPTKKIVIGSATYFLDDFQMEGNSVVGGRLVATLKKADGTLISNPQTEGIQEGIRWVIYRPANAYEAVYLVEPGDIPGWVYINAVGKGLNGLEGGGEGKFYVDPVAPPISIALSPTMVQPGGTVEVKAMSMRLLRNIEVNVPAFGITKLPLQQAVVPGMGEGAALYSGSISVPVTAPTMTVDVTAVANDLLGNPIAVSGTFMIDSGPPIVAVTASPSPSGLGAVAVKALVNEPLDYISASYTDASGAISNILLSYAGFSSDGYLYKGELMLAEGVAVDGAGNISVAGIDRVGHLGRGNATLLVDLTPPVSVSALTAIVDGHKGIRLSWVYPNPGDAIGLKVYRQSHLLTDPAMSAMILSFYDTGIEYGYLYDYQVVAIDAAGNNSEPGAARVWFDVDAPTTTIDINGPAWPGNEEIFVAGISTFGLTASDTGSGIVSETLYRQRTAEPFAVYREPFTGSVLDERSMIDFYSVDPAGNRELIRTATVFVDTKPPVVRFVPKNPYFRGAGQPVQFKLPEGLDKYSAAELIWTFTVNGLSPGPYDNPDEVLNSVINGTKLSALSSGVSGLFVGPTTEIGYYASDGEPSGAGVRDIWYEFEGEGPVRFGPDDPVVLRPADTHPEGSYLLKTYGCDRVDNCTNREGSGEGMLEKVIVDVTPPANGIEMKPWPQGMPDENQYITDDTKVFFSGKDYGKFPSGVNRIEWRLDGETEWQSVGLLNKFNLSGYAFGTHQIYWRGVDNVENHQADWDFGPFRLTTREWPRQMFSNASSGSPELEDVTEPYALDWSRVGAAVRQIITGNHRVYTLLLKSSSTLICAHALEDGTFLWSLTLTGQIAKGMAYDDELLVMTVAGTATTSDKLVGVRADTGVAVWTREKIISRLYRLSVPQPAGQFRGEGFHGRLDFVALRPTSSDYVSLLVALDHRTGDMRWFSILPAAPIDAQVNGTVTVTTNGPVAVRDGIVVVSIQDGLFAFNAVTSGLLWGSAARSPLRAPSIIEDMVVVPAMQEGTLGVEALGLDGSFKWFCPLVANASTTTFCSAAVGDIRKGIYLVYGTKLYSIEGNTGSLAWSTDVGTSVTQPIIVNGAVYLVGNGTTPQERSKVRLRVYRESPPTSGQIIEAWKSPESMGMAVCMPIMARSRLLVSSTDKNGSIFCYSNNTPKSYAIAYQEPLVAGVPFSMTVTAVDILGRQVVTYNNTVSYKTTDQYAELTLSTLLTAGKGFAPRTVFNSSGTINFWVMENPGTMITNYMLQVLPPPPVNLGVEGGDGKGDLNWNYSLMPGVEIARYQVYRSTGATGPYELNGVTFGVTATSYTDLSAVNSVPWYYRVSAIDVAGLESPWTLPVWVVPYPGPTKPTSLEAKGVEGGVSLSWLASSSVLNPLAGYDVFRRAGTSPFSPIGRISGAQTVTYLDDTAVEGREYTYMVRAWDTTLRRGEPSSEAPAIAQTERAWRHLQRTVLHKGEALDEAFNLPVSRKWGTTAGSNIGVVIKDGKAFQGTPTGVTALDLASGTKLWTQNEIAYMSGSVVKWPATQGGTIYYTGGGSLVALASNGDAKFQTTTVLWRYPLGNVSNSGANSLRVGPTVAGGGVYVGMRGMAFDVDAFSGILRWSATLIGADRIERVFPPVVSGSQAIFLTDAGRLYSFGTGGYDPFLKRGTIYYSTNLGIKGLTAAPTLAEDALIVPAKSSLVALNVGNGKTAWTWASVGVTFPAEAAYSSGTVFAVSGNDGILRAFRASTGEALWSFNPNAAGNYRSATSGSAVAVAGGVAYYTVNFTPSKGPVIGKLIGVMIPPAGSQPSLAYMSTEDIGSTNESPAVAQMTIVLGNAAFGKKEAVKLVLSPSVTEAVSNAPFKVTISGMTADGILDAGFSGQVRLTTSDPDAPVKEWLVTLVNGIGVADNVILVKPGKSCFSAYVVSTPGIAGSVCLGVHPTTGTVDKFLVLAPASAYSGVCFSVTVTAADQFNNTVVNYSGTASLSTSAVVANLPVSVVLTNGKAVIGATLYSTGSQTITAVGASLTYPPTGFATINILPVHLSIAAPSSVQASTDFGIAISVLDENGTVIAPYRGTISFDSINNAVLPAPYAYTSLDAGVHGFTLNLGTSGTQTVTVRDVMSGGLITGNSMVDVQAGKIITVIHLPGNNQGIDDWDFINGSGWVVGADWVNDFYQYKVWKLSGSSIVDEKVIPNTGCPAGYFTKSIALTSPDTGYLGTSALID